MSIENRLPPDEYKARCKEVLQRDGWRCRLCGRRNTLHVHHVLFRSRGGKDTLNNLLTVCYLQHEQIHKKELILFGDANCFVTVQDKKKQIRYNV